LETFPSAKTGYSFPVVGIGASAGGLKAIQALLAHLPNQTGMAYVIVQHLSRNFKSLMKEILEKETRLPVQMATDGLTLKPDNIYLIPAGRSLTITQNHFIVKDQDQDTPIHFVIDIFFHSLGVEAKDNAIGIILSGTGTDGSRGIRTIKEEGGMVLVQDPDSGDFDGMPLSAIDTHIVDFVLSPDEIAEKLKELADIRAGHSPPPDARQELGSSIPHIFGNVLPILKKQTAVDFGQYKPNTIQRRIEKHMTMHSVKDVEKYEAFLRSQPERVDELYEEILIGVTEFFRDPDAYQALEEKVFPQFLNKLVNHDQIRIWVSGCASGEEVYSIAILLFEFARAHGYTPNFTLLATDISGRALRKASSGAYFPHEIKRVPQELVDRYFLFDGEKYQIIPSVRDNIAFARNDLTLDPPFVNLDLIICRNLLIYLKNRAQRRAILNFHFGLNQGGYMMLGPSENILDLASSFLVLDDRWKIFQAQGATPSIRRYLTFSDVNRPIRKKIPVSTPIRQPDSFSRSHTRTALINLMLNRYPVPFAVFSMEGELVFSGGGAGQFMRVPGLSPNSNVFNMVSKASITALRDAQRRFQQQPGPFSYPDIQVDDHNELPRRTLFLEKLPLSEQDEVIMLEWRDASGDNGAGTTGETIHLKQEEAELLNVVKDLQEKLMAAEYEVENTLEQLETSNEELQAANEELIASNEELQSTNEELQSVNEELHTVNSELQTRNDELTRANDTIDNLISSMDVGALHLDMELRIQFFTPAFTQISSLSQGDIGTHIEKFRFKWQYPRLLNEVFQVLESGKILEREVMSEDRKEVFLVRLFPFKAGKKREGVVITFVNITRLKAVERTLKASEQNQKRILDAVPLIITIFSFAGTIKYINRPQGGYDRDQMIGTSIFDYTNQQNKSELQTLIEQVKTTGEIAQYPFISRSIEGGALRWQNVMVPIQTGKGDVEDLLTVSLKLDQQQLITEAEYTRLNHYASLMNNNATLFSLKDKDFTYQYTSPSMAELLKKPITAIVGQNDFSIFPEQVVHSLRALDQQVLSQQGNILSLDKYELGDLEFRTMSMRFLTKSKEGAIRIGQIGILLGEDFFLGSDSDVETQKRLERVVIDRTEALAAANQELRTITRSMAHDLRTPLRAIQSFGEILFRSLDERLSEQERVHFGKIMRQSRKMSQILSGLISYVKLGSIAVRKEWLDTKVIAREVWEELNHLLIEDQQELIFHNCPPIWADLFMTRQVITNLFSNSIKYRSPHRPLSVEFGAYSDDKTDRWVYYVKDNGIGFSPQHAERIFGVFERLHEGQQQDGYGVGLSIVKKSIELMGGRVWATSQIDQGATFYFNLPKEGGTELQS